MNCIKEFFCRLDKAIFSWDVFGEGNEPYIPNFEQSLSMFKMPESHHRAAIQKTHIGGGRLVTIKPMPFWEAC